MSKSILFMILFLLLTTGVARDPLAINANELQKAYAENSLAANHKYRDQEVILVGKITLIYDMKEHGDDRGYLSFQGSDWRLNEKNVVTCLFENPRLLLSLRIGSMVQVRGTVWGNEQYEEEWGRWDMIWLIDCSLVRPYNGPRW